MPGESHGQKRSQRVGHDGSDLAAAAAARAGDIGYRGSIVPGRFPWRRKQQPTPVFLPGKSHGQRSLVAFRLWDRTELDMTEVT